jgi:predicted RecA/RadA family phage recombinase
MENYVSEGKVIKFTAASNYTTGQGLELGDRAGVVANTVASGSEGELLVDGIVTLAKTSVAMSVGEKLFWDTADANVQKTSDTGTNKAIGWAAETKASGVTSIKVKLGAF